MAVLTYAQEAIPNESLGAKVAIIMNVYRVPLRVVFYKEDGQWVAHCLEFDLVGSGVSKQAALDCLTEAISLQLQFSVENENPYNLFCPADAKFLRMFTAGSDIVTGELKFQIETVDNVVIQEPQMREYLDSETDLVPA